MDFEAFTVSKELAEKVVQISPPPEPVTPERPMVFRLDAIGDGFSNEELLTGAPYNIERVQLFIGRRVLEVAGSTTLEIAAHAPNTDLTVFDEGKVHPDIEMKMLQDLNLEHHADAVEVVRFAVGEFCVWLMSQPDLCREWNVLELEAEKLVVRCVPLSPDL